MIWWGEAEQGMVSLAQRRQEVTCSQPVLLMGKQGKLLTLDKKFTGFALCQGKLLQLVWSRSGWLCSLPFPCSILPLLFSFLQTTDPKYLKYRLHGRVLLLQKQNFPCCLFLSCPGRESGLTASLVLCPGKLLHSHG